LEDPSVPVMRQLAKQTYRGARMLQHEAEKTRLWHNIWEKIKMFLSIKPVFQSIFNDLLLGRVA